jgi:hypothetical protein
MTGLRSDEGNGLNYRLRRAANTSDVSVNMQEADTAATQPQNG